MGLHAAEPVRFAYAEAAHLARRLRATASEVDAGAEARGRWAVEALREWRGRYADSFRADAGIARRDAAELSAALRAAADRLDELAEQARQEQQRRDRAAAWLAEQERESGLEKLVEKVLGTDERPPFLSTPPPPAPVVAGPPSLVGRSR